MSISNWSPFDYQNKRDTAPKAGVPVWIVDEFDDGDVTFGYFDGFTFRTWTGSDDCSVSYWAPIEYPGAPTVTP